MLGVVDTQGGVGGAVAHAVDDLGRAVHEEALLLAEAQLEDEAVGLANDLAISCGPGRLAECFRGPNRIGQPLHINARGDTRPATAVHIQPPDHDRGRGRGGIHLRVGQPVAHLEDEIGVLAEAGHAGHLAPGLGVPGDEGRRAIGPEVVTIERQRAVADHAPASVAILGVPPGDGQQGLARIVVLGRGGHRGREDRLKAAVGPVHGRNGLQQLPGQCRVASPLGVVQGRQGHQGRGAQGVLAVGRRDVAGPRRAWKRLYQLGKRSQGGGGGGQRLGIAAVGCVNRTHPRGPRLTNPVVVLGPIHVPAGQELVAEEAIFSLPMAQVAGQVVGGGSQ